MALSSEVKRAPARCIECGIGKIEWPGRLCNACHACEGNPALRSALFKLPEIETHKVDRFQLIELD